MTDRELLELAAKALGITVLRDPNGDLRNCSGFNKAANIFAAPEWNPLTDDGDALRLAVSLRLNINLDCLGPITASSVRAGVNKSGDCDDPYAATRRAIVFAAAEIGRSLP